MGIALGKGEGNGKGKGYADGDADAAPPPTGGTYFSMECFQGSLEAPPPSFHVPREVFQEEMCQEKMCQNTSVSLPYREVQDMVCLEPHWMQHTRLLRHLKVFQRIFVWSPQLEKQCQSHAFVSSLLDRLIQKAYGKGRDAKCLMTGRDVYSTLEGFARSPHGGSQANVGLCFLIMLHHDKADAIVAKLGELCDRASRCTSAQKQAYNILVSHAAHTLELAVKRGGCGSDAELAEDLATRDGAMRRLHDCVEDFLDDFKERAWKSAIHEPARFYFDAIEDIGGRDHVNIHGLNAYLCLLRGGLGVQLPLMPLEDDPSYHMGLASPWESLSSQAWQHFASPEHFGVDFEGIPALRQGGAFVTKRAGRGSLDGDPKSLEQRAASGDPILEIYMARFAHFFREDFLVQRMFETLNAEHKPEHMGFRKACETLYGVYCEEGRAHEGSLVEHLYDEYFTSLDVRRASAFFQWLGIMKPSIAHETQHSSSGWV